MLIELISIMTDNYSEAQLYSIRIKAKANYIKMANLATFLAGLSLRLITEKFLKHNIIKPTKSAIDLV